MRLSHILVGNLGYGECFYHSIREDEVVGVTFRGS